MNDTREMTIAERLTALEEWRAREEPWRTAMEAHRDWTFKYLHEINETIRQVLEREPAGRQG